jgi:hypothetical protein
VPHELFHHNLASPPVFQRRADDGEGWAAFVGLGRVRLRRLWNVGEQFLLAATAQNLKRLVRFLKPRPTTLNAQQLG